MDDIEENAQNAERTATPRNDVPLRSAAFPPSGPTEPEGNVVIAERVPTQNAGTRSGTDEQTIPERTAEPAGTSRFAAWRTNRVRTAEQRNAEVRAARDRLNEARNAAARTAAVRRNTAKPTAVRSGLKDDEIAPVPMVLRKIGIWLQRTIGALPTIAPLVISGVFTYRAAVDDQGINLHWLFALFATVALEGGLWKLAQMLDRHLLEGDGTVSLRLSIALWIGIISGFIYWHANEIAQLNGHGGAHDEFAWVPAAVSAGFCVLGIRMTTHQARFNHRVQLRQEGRMDGQAPKFSALSWVLCPWETYWALRHAVKYRIPSPIEAVEDYRLFRAFDKPRIWPVPEFMEQAAGTQNASGTDRGVARQNEIGSSGGTQNGVPAIEGRSVPLAIPSAAAAPERTSGTQNGTTLSVMLGNPQNAQNVQSPAAFSADRSGTDQDEARVLKYAGSDYLTAVAAQIPSWQNADKPPSVTAITAAIATHRGDGWNSRGTAFDVRKALITMRERPELIPGSLLAGSN